MYVSPIMMIPKFKTIKQLQEIFLDQVGDMSIRNGPQMTNKVRESTRVAVKKQDYAERSTLVAAPILFQTRGTKTAECPFNYSSVFVQKMHAKALTDKCDASIYACDAGVSQVESISTCTGTGNQSEMYFGRLPLKFLGKTGYADFLASIADNSFIFRQLRNGSAEGGKNILSLPFAPASRANVKADNGRCGGGCCTPEIMTNPQTRSPHLQLDSALTIALSTPAGAASLDCA